jgi:phosphatidylethanolamine/phosphatidyl-N-methylethanolamine N-methyltransferase
VVSSLPIKWFSLEAQCAVLRPCFARLGPDGHFLQLTNAFSSPLPLDHLGITGREAARVWRNVPPAQIWAYAPRAGSALERTR